jgi:cytidylate kinase
MIYWQLWAKYTAASRLDAGDWGAFALVLASALTCWMLLTVFALAASREPRIRRVLSREMIAYRAVG